MNIVIVEDSELIRIHLLDIVATQPRIHVVGVATEEEAAINLIMDTAPDAVLLDLSLAPGSGIRVLQRIGHFHQLTGEDGVGAKRLGA